MRVSEGNTRKARGIFRIWFFSTPSWILLSALYYRALFLDGGGWVFLFYLKKWNTEKLCQSSKLFLRSCAFRLSSSFFLPPFPSIWRLTCYIFTFICVLLCFLSKNTNGMWYLHPIYFFSLFILSTFVV